MTRFLTFIICLLSLNGCSETGPVKKHEFEFASVIKNDIDLITETHQQVVFSALYEMAVKLYKINPAEWKKGNYPSLSTAIENIASATSLSVQGKSSTECIRLAFDEAYQGDRVGALIIGLKSMIYKAYDQKRRFYILDLLDAQKLYDSARNLELTAWMLRSKTDNEGNILLVSSVGEEGVNLSFERLFGKMINAQDMMAQIIADRSNRQIRYVLQTLMTTFIPI